MQLVRYDGTADWALINRAPELADAVTAADLKRVARRYLTAENRTVGTFLRRAGTAPEDPEVAKLAPPAQAMVKQASQQIAAETDRAKLQQMVERMQQMAGQVPPEMKPAFEIVLKRASDRLAALASAAK